VVRALLPLITRFGARPRRSSDGAPKVTILLYNAYGMGGTVRTAFNLAAYLARRFDVEIVTVHRRRRHALMPFPAGVKMTALNDTVGHQGRRLRLGRAILGRQPSHLVNVEDRRYPDFSLWSDLLIMRHLRRVTGVLITTRPGFNILAARHAPRGVRTIGQEHMNLASHRPLLRADIERFYPRLDALAVLTDHDRRDYAALLGPESPPVLLMPNAVPQIDGGLSDNSSKVVIAAGRLTRQKGLDRLVPAWAPIARAHPDWSLEIYGEGIERPRLEGLVGEHGLEGVVKLMGRTNEIGRAYEQASIFVLSSRREGLPMVILEAMSKGLPVVSFDCPTGPAEVIANGHNGILVPDGDVEALTGALLDVIEDDELRVRLGKGALETAKEYDIEAVGLKWAELVDQLLTRNQSGQSTSVGK
jgi:glycosyltransferase involved in cell wall biosynthesis